MGMMSAVITPLMSGPREGKGKGTPSTSRRGTTRNARKKPSVANIETIDATAVMGSMPRLEGRGSSATSPPVIAL